VPLVWKLCLSICGGAWLVAAIRAFLGMRRVPHLGDATPLPDRDCPRLSILATARDEERKLPEALSSWLGQDYPDYSVVAVDDRSSDSTGAILDTRARTDTRLRVLHITELPAGWLGKPHALAAAAAQSDADWLVFTDADVRFAPQLVRRAVSLAVEKGWDHLSLLGALELKGFGETAMITFFGLGWALGFQPWQVTNPRSGVYMGVGAFQLVKRSVYEAVGTHRRLAMEVIEDMKLGKLVKQGGFRSGVAFSDGMLRVRWLEGLRNVIGGLTKNTFAACNFSLALTLGRVAALIALSVVPWVALLAGPSWLRLRAAFPVAVTAVTQGEVAAVLGASRFYGLTHPLGALLSAYLLAHSAAVTLLRRGIVWRGTFYPLDQLRKGRV
jgi:hypothetical protein